MPEKQLHVVLCDDCEDDRFFFKKAFQKLSFPARLDLVCDGAELTDFLNKSRDKPPDVLFLDLNMPKKNGFECLKEIKDDEAFRRMVILIMSTTDQDDAVNRTYAGCASLYVVKPSDFDQLTMLIERSILIVKNNGYAKLPRDRYVLTGMR